jgi:hypothetical protein
MIAVDVVFDAENEGSERRRFKLSMGAFANLIDRL